MFLIKNLHKATVALVWGLAAFFASFQLFGRSYTITILATVVACLAALFIFTVENRIAAILSIQREEKFATSIKVLLPRAILALLFSSGFCLLVLMSVFKGNITALVISGAAFNRFDALALLVQRSSIITLITYVFILILFLIDFSGVYFKALQVRVESTLSDQTSFLKRNIPQIIASLVWGVGGFFVTLKLISLPPYTFFVALVVAGLTTLFIASVDIKVASILEGLSQNSRFSNFIVLIPRAVIAGIFSFTLAVAVLLEVFNSGVSRILNIGDANNKFDALFLYIKQTDIGSLIFYLITLLFFLMDFAGIFLKVFQQNKSVLQEKEEVIKSQQEEIKIANDQQIQIIASIQHELGNKLPAAKNYFSDLVRGLDYAASQPESFTIKRKVRDTLPGELDSEVDTLEAVVHRIESGLNYSISIVDNIGGIVSADPSRFKPERKSLLAFIKEFSQTSATSHNFKLEARGEEVFLEFDVKQMSVVLNNLITNAIRHSFLDRTYTYHLLFEVTRSGSEVELFVRNDGEPFEPGFSIKEYLAYDKYAGKNGNTGIGGYLNGLIISNHKGKIELVDPSTDSKYKVNIKITLPLTQTTQYELTH